MLFIHNQQPPQEFFTPIPVFSPQKRNFANPNIQITQIAITQQPIVLYHWWHRWTRMVL